MTCHVVYGFRIVYDCYIVKCCGCGFIVRFDRINTSFCRFCVERPNTEWKWCSCETCLRKLLIYNLCLCLFNVFLNTKSNFYELWDQSHQLLSSRLSSHTSKNLSSVIKPHPTLVPSYTNQYFSFLLYILFLRTSSYRDSLLLFKIKYTHVHNWKRLSIYATHMKETGSLASFYLRYTDIYLRIPRKNL